MFLWGSVIGVLTQWFINMEIELHPRHRRDRAHRLQTLERTIFLKVTAIVLFIIVAAIFAISAETFGGTALGGDELRSGTGRELGWALVLGAVVFAGAAGSGSGSGGQNLRQNNWIRDKGFGMGAYIPGLNSPVTGEEEAAPSTGHVLEANEADLSRWHR